MNYNELAAIRNSQVEAFRASGQTAAEWCKENDISISSLRYWITRVNRYNRQTQQEFIAFSPAASEASPIVVKIGSFNIEVNQGFDQSTFRDMILVLKNL